MVAMGVVSVVSETPEGAEVVLEEAKISIWR
jgi:hypothetical protein